MLAAVLLIAPTLATAQTDMATIAGTVRDTTGAVLPGVTIEASSPVLIEKVRAVLSDSQGQYKIVELRPGTYTVTFILQGFSTVRREGIELTSGFTATVNGDLRVGSVTETITVTGESPVVDLQNTRQQVVVTRDVIDAVPTGRSFQNLGVLIPGIVGGQVVGSTVTQDVGGQSGQNFMTMAIHGGRQTDQRIEIDGMSMSAWTRPDSSAVMFTDGNFQEYAIDVASKSAESETGGVRVNMIPREGGNQFRGSFFGNFGASGLQSANIDTDLERRGLGAGNRLKRLWSVNPTVGGPISQDRLWFFGTFSYQVADQLVANQFLNKNPKAFLFEADLTQQAVDDQNSRDLSGRFTIQATPRNKFTAYVSYNYACHCHFLIGPTIATLPALTADGSTFLEIPNYIAQGTWTSPITSRLLVEGGFSYVLEDQHFTPQPDSTEPAILDFGFNRAYRSTVINMDAYTPNYSGRGSVSYVTGSHALKAGFTMIVGRYDNYNRTVGNMQIIAFNGAPIQVTYSGNPVVVTNRVRPNLGIYAQDQWTVNRLTVNAGLRFDYFRADYPDHNVPATQFVPFVRSFSGLEAVSWKDLNPRLGVAYDLFGNGKTAIKGSASRYVLGDGTSRAQTLNPVLSNNTNPRTWFDPSGDRIIQGDPLNPLANEELGPSQNLNFGRPAALTIRYDPDWAKGFGLRQYNWEFSAGVQHEVMPRVAANFSYFRRIYGNFPVTDNRSIAPGDHDPFCVTAPSDTRLPGGGGQRICDLFDRAQSTVGLIDNLVTLASNYGDQFEHWNGVDFTMNARLSNVLLQGGVSTGKSMLDDCQIRADLPEAAATNPFCRTETPFLTQVKMLGSYTLPWDVQIAGTFQSIPGPQITASATYTRAQVLPELGRNLVTSTVAVPLVRPGTLYGDRLNQIDLRFAKIFRSGQRRVQVMADIYNLMNGNVVTSLSNTFGATTGALTGSAWLIPQAILPGRIAKFGVQVNF